MNLGQFQFSEDELDGVGEDANPCLAEPREALQLPALARGIGVPVAPEVMDALHASMND